MTQHQAPEVTSELLPCPLCNREPKRNGRTGAGGVICRHGGHLVQVYGASQADADKNWNTRASQPLSLTVDEIRRRLSAMMPDDRTLDSMATYTVNADDLRALLDRLQSLSLSAAGEQIAENANCSVDIDRSGLAQEVE